MILIIIYNGNLYHTFFTLHHTLCIPYDHLSHINFYDIYRKRLGHFSFQFLRVTL